MKTLTEDQTARMAFANRMKLLGFVHTAANVEAGLRCELGLAPDYGRTTLTDSDLRAFDNVEKP